MLTSHHNISYTAKIRMLFAPNIKMQTTLNQYFQLMQAVVHYYAMTTNSSALND